jgi:hypothetical protein
MRLHRVILIVHRILEDPFTTGRDQTEYQTLPDRSAGVIPRISKAIAMR